MSLFTSVISFAVGVQLSICHLSDQCGPIIAVHVDYQFHVGSCRLSEDDHVSSSFPTFVPIDFTKLGRYVSDFVIEVINNLWHNSHWKKISLLFFHFLFRDCCFRLVLRKGSEIYIYSTIFTWASSAFSSTIFQSHWKPREMVRWFPLGEEQRTGEPRAWEENKTAGPS